METLTTRLKKSHKDLAEHGAQLLDQTRDAGKGFATFVQGEARDWSSYLKERAADIRLEDVKSNATELLGRVTGKAPVGEETSSDEETGDLETETAEA